MVPCARARPNRRERPKGSAPGGRRAVSPRKRAARERRNRDRCRSRRFIPFTRARSFAEFPALLKPGVPPRTGGASRTAGRTCAGDGGLDDDARRANLSQLLEQLQRLVLDGLLHLLDRRLRFRLGQQPALLRPPPFFHGFHGAGGTARPGPVREGGRRSGKDQKNQEAEPRFHLISPLRNAIKRVGILSRDASSGDNAVNLYPSRENFQAGISSRVDTPRRRREPGGQGRPCGSRTTDHDSARRVYRGRRRLPRRPHQTDLTSQEKPHPPRAAPYLNPP